MFKYKTLKIYTVPYAKINAVPCFNILKICPIPCCTSPYPNNTQWTPSHGKHASYMKSFSIANRRKLRLKQHQ